jgi:hypothetical protein
VVLGSKKETHVTMVLSRRKTIQTLELQPLMIFGSTNDQVDG